MDLGFASGLLVVAAAWLVILRDAAWIHTWPAVIVFAMVFAGVLLGWIYVATRDASAQLPPGAEQKESPRVERRSRVISGAVLGFALLVLMWVSFYQPLKIHFWGGADEFLSLQSAPLWNPRPDLFVSRPFNSLPCQLALWLTPGSVLGSLWVAAALCFFNSVLLFAIIKKVAPRAVVTALCAAVLLMVNRGDVSRFFVMHTTNFYWTPLFFLLVAIWLFLLSYERRSRSLLVLSCALLASSFLSNEGTFPLSLLGLVLLRMLRWDRKMFFVWAFTWTGTMGVLAARFVIFLAGQAHGYQAMQAEAALRDPSYFLASLKLHLGASASYFAGLDAWGLFWAWGLAALLPCALAFRSVIREAGNAVCSWRLEFGGMALGGAALLLGALPFLHIPHLFRTHFLAAPGEATLLAFLIAFTGNRLPVRFSRWFNVACASTLAAMAAVAAFRDQTEQRRYANIYFEKTVHIFQQVHALAPTLAPDSLVLFALADNNPTPLGVNYALFHLAKTVLGSPALQVNFPNVTGLDFFAAFSKEDVSVDYLNFDGLGRQNRKYRYDQVIVFGLSMDGTVSLLEEVPATLLPEDTRLLNYSPLALMKPGPVGELPFLRYPRWAEKPHDILDLSPGMMLARNWGALTWTHGRLYREATSDARLAVNPMGGTSRRLLLNVRPPAGPGPWDLQAIGEDGLVAATATISKHQDVRLELPVDARRINLFDLRLQGRGSQPEAAFRVYCPGVKTAPKPFPSTRLREIASDGVSLGNNWYPLEHFAGESFRWVNNDAEITLTAVAPAHSGLLLKVEPGPGMGNDSCRLQLLDADGRAVAEMNFEKRTTIRFALPKAVTPASAFRLHVVGGGAHTPKDPRILNFRVFDCATVE